MTIARTRGRDDPPPETGTSGTSCTQSASHRLDLTAKTLKSTLAYFNITTTAVREPLLLRLLYENVPVAPAYARVPPVTMPCPLDAVNVVLKLR